MEEGANEEEHKKYHIKLMYICVAILIVLVIGTLFYHNIEGWDYLDALYFSTATITTVGYGDFTPRTDIGKLFTIFYIFIGVGIALYGLSIIVAHFVEMREKFWFGRFNIVRRIFRRKNKNI